MDKLHALRVVWLVIFLLFLSVCLNVGLVLRWRWRSPSKARATAKKAFLSAVTLGLTFFAFETYFAWFHVHTDVANHTFASQLWFYEYWKPINRLGYRDGNDKRFAGRKVAFFVGDSFTAGYGIRKTPDRFADLVGQQLGSDWEYAVVARNGWQTGQMLEGMRSHPAQPALIVFNHYVNDITDAANYKGVARPATLREPGPFQKVFVHKSFFVNWLFWRGTRFRLGDDYWTYLVSCFHREDSWGRHEQELQQVLDYAAAKNARLLVVVWPNLRQVEESRVMTDKVVAFFRDKGVSVVDMAEALKEEPPQRIVVNPMDAHPNEWTHRLAAERIGLALGLPPLPPLPPTRP